METSILCACVGEQANSSPSSAFCMDSEPSPHKTTGKHPQKLGNLNSKNQPVKQPKAGSAFLNKQGKTTVLFKHVYDSPFNVPWYGHISRFSDFQKALC